MKKRYLVILLLAFKIAIANEKKGLELGENSISFGRNSISTSINGISVGDSALTTGDGETRESIEARLSENSEKMLEINNTKNDLIKKNKELTDKQVKERETISAGLRVEELNRLKEEARKNLELKRNELINLENQNNEYIAEHEAKIKDLNRRLYGMSEIQGINHKDDSSLEDGAIKLKQKVEEGANFSLDKDFYKEYIKSYYTSLGDLNKHRYIAEKSRNYRLDKSQIDENIMPLNFENKNTVNGGEIIPGVLGYRNINSGEETNNPGSATENFYVINTKIVKTKGHNNNYNNLSRDYRENTYDNYESSDMLSTDINLTSTLPEEKYQIWLDIKNGFKQNQKEIWGNISNGFFSVSDSPEVMKMIDQLLDYEYERLDNGYSVMYYQWKYDNTKDNSWLDKKNIALENYKKIGNKEYVDELFRKIQLEFDGKVLNYRSIESTVFGTLADKYKRENIDVIEDKLKFSIETLTTNLTDALGIDKDELLRKKKEIEDKKRELIQVEKNYEAINPTAEDIELSEEYKKVKAEIDRLVEEIKEGEERIKQLESEMTVNELINKGSDNIAYGTRALTIGDRSISIGKESTVIGNDSTALGTSNLIQGHNSTVIGKGNVVNGQNIHIQGNDNMVGDIERGLVKSDVFILGSNIDARDAENAIVLGNGSKAISNALSVGTQDQTRAIKFVKEAEISETSKDAVNGSQLYSIANASLPEIDVLKWKNKLGINPNGDVIATPNAVTYTNDEHNEVYLGKENSPVKISNVSLPVNKRDAANKQYVDTVVSSVNSGVASAIAHANVPTNNINKTHTLGAAMGYYDKDWAVSLGYSGVEKNIGFKITGAINSSLKPTVGAGISYTFGDLTGSTVDKNPEKLNTQLLEFEKEIVRKIENLASDVDKLKNGMKVYDDSELKKELFELKKQIRDISHEKVKEVIKEQTLVLDNFEFDKYDLSKENINKLEEFISNIDNISKITIVGNADLKGGENYNLLLSQKRAKEVRDYLVLNLKIDPKKINYYGVSSREIISSEDNLNRRVEIIVK